MLFFWSVDWVQIIMVLILYNFVIQIIHDVLNFGFIVLYW